MPHESSLRRLFRECVDQNADSLFRVAYRLTGANDLAQELVQETYLNAWKSLESLRDESRMRAWMFAILRNQYSKLRKRLPPLASISSENIGELADEKSSDQSDQQQLVQEAVRKLDDEHKFPLLLVSMEGMSVEAAAETLDLPRGTVLSRLHRARQKLRQILEPRLDEIREK